MIVFNDLRRQEPVYKQSFRETWPALAANTTRMHITFVNLVINDACKDLVQTALNKVELRRKRRVIVHPWQWNKVGAITVCDLGLEAL